MITFECVLNQLHLKSVQNEEQDLVPKTESLKLQKEIHFSENLI